LKRFAERLVRRVRALIAPGTWANVRTLATSLLTVVGAILGDRYHGDKITWGGLAARATIANHNTYRALQRID
jgi:hypothetical protein